ncbi:hypothetical protein CGLO_13935 [Colletotrichum gloeosporioides Cg-14]|jgi:hypothetical protein
MLLK